jgi:rhodanese-related sulfurtransferase
MTPTRTCRADQPACITCGDGLLRRGRLDSPPLRRREVLLLALLLALSGAGARWAAQAHQVSTAKAWLAEGAVLLDVRAPDAFVAGHLAGARSAPGAVLGPDLHISGSNQVVLYGSSDAAAVAAVARLRAAGFTPVIGLASMAELR